MQRKYGRNFKKHCANYYWSAMINGHVGLSHQQPNETML